MITESQAGIECGKLIKVGLQWLIKLHAKDRETW